MPWKTGSWFLVRCCFVIDCRNWIVPELVFRPAFQNVPDDRCQFSHDGHSRDFRATPLFDRLVPIPHRLVLAGHMNDRMVQGRPRNRASWFCDQRSTLHRGWAAARCHNSAHDVRWQQSINNEASTNKRGNDSRIIEAEGYCGEAARFLSGVGKRSMSQMRESKVNAPRWLIPGIDTKYPFTAFEILKAMYLSFWRGFDRE